MLSLVLPQTLRWSQDLRSSSRGAQQPPQSSARISIVLHCHSCLVQFLESSLHATIPCPFIIAFSYSKSINLRANHPSAFLIVWQMSWILMITLADSTACHENSHSVNATTFYLFALNRTKTIKCVYACSHNYGLHLQSFNLSHA